MGPEFGPFCWGRKIQTGAAQCGQQGQIRWYMCFRQCKLAAAHVHDTVCTIIHIIIYIGFDTRIHSYSHMFKNIIQDIRSNFSQMSPNCALITMLLHFHCYLVPYGPWELELTSHRSCMWFLHQILAENISELRTLQLEYHNYDTIIIYHHHVLDGFQYLPHIFLHFPIFSPYRLHKNFSAPRPSMYGSVAMFDSQVKDDFSPKDGGFLTQKAMVSPKENDLQIGGCFICQSSGWQGSKIGGIGLDQWIQEVMHIFGFVGAFGLCFCFLVVSSKGERPTLIHFGVRSNFFYSAR